MSNYFSYNDLQTETDNRTQCEQVRQHLKEGGTLTTFDAIRLYNITCLAQRIHDLRTRYGLIIDSNPVKHNGKRFVVYSWNPANDATDNAPAFDTIQSLDNDATTTAPVTDS